MNHRYLSRLRALLGLARLAVVVIAMTAAQSFGQLSRSSDDPPASPATNSGDAQSDLAATEPEALQQGPVHEAFAAPIGDAGQAAHDQDDAQLISEEPPEPIDELPPAEQPEGANVQWIPGYWMWAPDREDFVWVSGVWRDVPPGRTWAPGSWLEVDGGYMWSAGFWTEASVEQVSYLPPPPESLEQGPSSPAPSESHFWVPGCWSYQETNYRWRPGYWYQRQPGWVWVPSYYNRTPRGYVYVNGYWDFPITRRGVLYAPVYWGNRGYRNAGYAYQPRSVVNTALLVTSLFVNPNRSHYYYYGGNGLGYQSPGFYPWFNYAQLGPRRYDPLYSYYQGSNRRGPNRGVDAWTIDQLRRQYARFDDDRGRRGDGRRRDADGFRDGDFDRRDQRPGDLRDQRRGQRGDRSDVETVAANLIAPSYSDLRNRDSEANNRVMRQVDEQTAQNIRRSSNEYRDFRRERARIETIANADTAESLNNPAGRRPDSAALAGRDRPTDRGAASGRRTVLKMPAIDQSQSATPAVNPQSGQQPELQAGAQNNARRQLQNARDLQNQRLGERNAPRQLQEQPQRRGPSGQLDRPRTNQAEPNRGRPNQVQPDQSQPNQASPAQGRPDPRQFNPRQLNQRQPNQGQPTQARPNPRRPDFRQPGQAQPSAGPAQQNPRAGRPDGAGNRAGLNPASIPNRPQPRQASPQATPQARPQGPPAGQPSFRPGRPAGAAPRSAPRTAAPRPQPRAQPQPAQSRPAPRGGGGGPAKARPTGRPGGGRPGR